MGKGVDRKLRALKWKSEEWKKAVWMDGSRSLTGPRERDEMATEENVWCLRMSRFDPVNCVENIIIMVMINRIGNGKELNVCGVLFLFCLMWPSRSHGFSERILSNEMEVLHAVAKNITD